MHCGKADADSDDTVESTVVNHKAGFHNSFMDVCSTFSRRTLHIRLDIGSYRLLYTSTLAHLGLEFFQTPVVTFATSVGHGNRVLQCVSWGNTPTNLTLHYRLGVGSVCEREILNWDRVHIDFDCDIGVPKTKLDVQIEDWMRMTPSFIKRKERRPSDLNDYPVLSVLRVHTAAGSKGKKIQTRTGTVGTVVIHRSWLMIMYGTIAEAIFAKHVEGKAMVAFIEESLKKRNARKLTASSANLSELIENPSDESTPIAPLFIVKDGEVGEKIDSYPAQVDIDISASGCHLPVRMGISYDEWDRYDAMLEKYDAVVAAADYVDRNREPRKEGICHAYGRFSMAGGTHSSNLAHADSVSLQ